MVGKGEVQFGLLEGCLEALEALGRATSLEEVLQKVDFLIEKLYLAKAGTQCCFDHQFFKDALRFDQSGKGFEVTTKQGGKRLRQLCLTFLRTFTVIGHKACYTEYLIPRLFTMIRLEISLRDIAQTKVENQNDSNAFPVAFLEYILGMVLYGEDCDSAFVETLLRDYLLAASEWIYHTYIALENIQKSLDTSEVKLYKNADVSNQVVFERFVSFLLKMPEPQKSIRRDAATTSHGDIDAVAGEHGSSDTSDVDSGSDVEYSDESESEDETDDADSDTENSDVEDPAQGITQKYNFTKVYSAVWQNVIFAKYPLPDRLLRHILNSMPTSVLPYARNPVIYSNWLMAHLNGKDKILSMLSLKSIFELILKYGLAELDEIGDENGDENVSAFYDRLYGHLSDDVLGSNYGGELLQFLSTAVKSTMLPSQLTAKFIKKIVRMACFTRCVESTILLTIAVNLLKMHNNTCLSLVHRDNIDGVKRTRDELNMERLEQSSAHDGSEDEMKQLFLWEISLLMNHFNERTAIVASTFYSDLRKRRSVLLKAEDVIGCDNREHLRQELTRARREEASTFRKTLQKPSKLVTQIFM
ncbi:CBF/Mak21 family protein [Babesia caballi]|uniref:CBF/Mak21 family protein n=1 Tax=Babesia caballi TaxID=5871 RepID=A0AAV4LSG0_BABCB|nr:CBF/Mak21 family protein [Babesia caballi]